MAAPPAWVLPADLPPAPPAAEGAATVTLLSDVQARLSANGDTRYFGTAFRINTPEGLDDASLQLSWDPDLETLAIHRYRIQRGGKVIDLLGDGSKLTIVRRETNLERAALDGELTATLQPDGLQVGDVVELAFSRTRYDPVRGGRSEMLSGPDDGVPYGRARLRVIWPTQQAIRWRAFPGVIQPRLIRDGAQNELVADLRNVVTPRAPQGAPSRFGVVNAVQLTEFADWRSVSRTFEPLYAKAATLGADSGLRAEITRIAAAAPDPKSRAEAALVLVQEKVRYLFLGMNDGGYVPADADLTWSRRFGDCKAKTVLLVALLRELGIEARPVLVNTEHGDFVAEELPVMGAFDHAIVEARIGGRSYWLDGTRLGDRHLDRLETPNYRVGLPIVAGGAELEPMIPTPLTEPAETTSLVLDATSGIDAPAPATAEMRFRNEAAADMRAKYAGLSAADRDDALRKLWRKTYDFVSPTNVSLREDAATGDFVATMAGTARMDWARDVGTRWYELDRVRLGWKFDTVREGELGRDAPFAFDYPDWWQSRETIRLPNGGRGFRLQGDPVDRSIGGAYAFHRTLSLNGDTVTMEADTRALTAELPAAKAEDTRAQMAELAQGTVFVRVPDDYMPTAGDIAALKNDKPALAQAYARRGAIRFDHGEADAALADEEAALAADPNLPMAAAVRAFILAGRDDPSAGAMADRAIALDPKQWLAWRAKGLIALKAGRFAQADDFFSKDLAIADRDQPALVGRGTARLALNRFEPARSDLDAALALGPNAAAYTLRATVLLTLGREEQALEDADHAVASQPDDPHARTTRAGVLAALGRRDDARADIDHLIALKPTASYYLARAGLWLPRDRDRRAADVDAALRLDPKSTPALSFRATDELDAGAFDRASADIATIAKLEPDVRQLDNLREQLLARQGRPAEALRIADAVVARHPGEATALNERCWLKATLNVAADTALADCEAALKLTPGNPGILDSRAFAKLRLGSLDGAAADYDAALRISPNLPASLYGRALVRVRRGDSEGARRDFASARRLAPDIDARFATYGMAPPSSMQATN